MILMHPGELHKDNIQKHNNNLVSGENVPLLMRYDNIIHTQLETLFL